MSLSNRVISIIREELDEIEEKIENRIDEKYHAIIDRLRHDTKELDWLNLPDYPLMQYQKDEINRAIEQILSNQLEIK